MIRAAMTRSSIKRLVATAVATVVLAGCAGISIPPDVIGGYKATQDIEAYCADRAKAAGESKNAKWQAHCTAEVAFRVRSTSFCEACAGRGGNFNGCVLKARDMHEGAMQDWKAQQEQGLPQIPLVCDRTVTSCFGYPDSATERDMKKSLDAKQRFNMTSWPGAYCPINQKPAVAK